MSGTESRRRGPLLGPALLVVAGGVIAFAPLRFGQLLAMVGGGSPVLGALFGGLVALCGIGVRLKPTLSRELGAAAIAFSLLSLFGALGGLVIGMVLGIVGGNLCLSWRPEPPAE